MHLVETNNFDNDDVSAAPPVQPDSPSLYDILNGRWATPTRERQKVKSRKGRERAGATLIKKV